MGYTVEWRVINAAEYGMPQRRRRTYIVGYLEGSNVYNKIESLRDWMLFDGVMAKAFPFIKEENLIQNLRLKVQ